MRGIRPLLVEQAWLAVSALGRRHADVPVGGGHGHAAARRAGDHALLDQERLVYVFHRFRLLADADRQRRQTDRPAAELLAERGEQRPVDFVEPEVVDTEQREAVARDVGGDRTVGPYLREVA